MRSFLVVSYKLVRKIKISEYLSIKSYEIQLEWTMYISRIHIFQSKSENWNNPIENRILTRLTVHS